MANACCINAYDKDGNFVCTLAVLNSDNIGNEFCYEIPDLNNTKVEYICYTDKCGACCRVDLENEFKITITNGYIKNIGTSTSLKGFGVCWYSCYGLNYTATMVRYKTGGYPTSITDGTQLTCITTQNQGTYYCVNSGLSDNTLYYIRIFALSGNEVINYADTSVTTKLWTNQFFGYTGAEQTYTIPETAQYKIEVWGAQGGSYSNMCGGYGGYAAGCICLTKGCLLRIYVGGQPASQTAMNTITNGGYNGGGNATTTCYSGTSTYAQAGGGGTDVRYNGATLCHRFIVAGGGAGTTNHYNFAPTSTNRGGGGACGCGTLCGTQTAAGANGSFGQGAHGSNGTSYRYHAGGGGGGWYGGGTDLTHSDSANCSACASGGSGYTYTSSTCGNHPNKACLGNLPRMTGACCYAPGTNFPSPSGATENGHQGCGCVKISLVG